VVDAERRLDADHVLAMITNSLKLSLIALFLFIDLVDSFKWPFSSSPSLATRPSGPNAFLDPSASGSA